MATNHASDETESQPGGPDAGAGPRRNRRRLSYLLTEQDEALLSQLPEKYVEILRQEGTMADIAARLHIAPGTVKSRTHRARVALDTLREQARQGVRH